MTPLSLPEKLALYYELLRKWQGAINLVSPATIAEARQRHFEDCLQITALPPPGSALFDFGSGAGFPGMVLAMARPDVQVTLIESDTKKCTFLSTVSRETMTPVMIVNQRIEDVSRETIPAIITARALAPLDKLLAYALPWAQENEKLELVFFKGAGVAAELARAREIYDFSSDSLPSSTGDGVILRITGLRAKQA